MDPILNLLETKYGKQEWFIFLKKLFYRCENHRISETGAQLTYYLILSILPFILFFLNLLNFTPLSSTTALNELLSPLPVEFQNLLLNLIQEIIDSSNTTLLSIGAIGTIWSSSKGIMAIIKSINRALELEEDRPYWKLRGLSIIFTFGLSIILLITLSILVFGEVIFNKIFASYTIPSWAIWQILKLLIPLGFMMLMFSLLYKFSPSIEKGVTIYYKDTIPGSLFVSIGWTVSSLLFSFYINNFDNYTKTYGSIGGLIILLIWLYISSIIIVLGAEVNATLISMKNISSKSSFNR